MDRNDEHPFIDPERRPPLVGVSRRQFGKVAAAVGFHAAFGAWYTTVRDGEVPTLRRVVEKALAIDRAEAAKPARYKLRHATTVTPKTEELMKYGVWEFAEDVAKRTDGEIRVEVIGGSALCGAMNCPQKLIGRTIDIDTGSSQNSAATFPYNNVLDYAYLFPNRASMYHFLYHPKADKLFRKVIREKYGLEWLFSHAETRNIFLGLKYKNGPAVRRPDDLRGAKLRITGSQMGRIALTQFGTNPIPLAWEETLEGLKSGLVDGQETYTTAAASFGMGPVLSQEIWVEFFPGFGNTYTRRDVLDAMKPAHQEAMLESGFAVQQFIQRKNEEYLTKLVGDTDPPIGGSLWAKLGIKVSRLDAKEKTAWEQLASPQYNPKPWEEWREKLTKIAGFDAYPELYKLVREIPEDTPVSAVKARRWWKDA
jgi:TRAP-type C4-dicarboxylate transport system substrate-binding protein